MAGAGLGVTMTEQTDLEFRDIVKLRQLRYAKEKAVGAIALKEATEQLDRFLYRNLGWLIDDAERGVLMRDCLPPRDLEWFVRRIESRVIASLLPFMPSSPAEESSGNAGIKSEEVFTEPRVTKSRKPKKAAKAKPDKKRKRSR